MTIGVLGLAMMIPGVEVGVSIGRGLRLIRHRSRMGGRLTGVMVAFHQKCLRGTDGRSPKGVYDDSA